MFSNLDRISNQRIRLDLWGMVCRKKRNKILVSPPGTCRHFKVTQKGGVCEGDEEENRKGEGSS